MSGGSGTLQFDQAQAYDSGGAVVSGFTSGDFIDFQAIAFSGSVLSWNQINTSSGTLTVFNGAISASITLLGQYAAGVGGSFTSANDGNGGTRVGDPPVLAQTDFWPTRIQHEQSRPLKGAPRFGAEALPNTC